MRALSFAAVVFFVSGLTGEAQAQNFPYDAVVVEDGVYVRSGKGEKYYATTRLAKGHRVRVHRHDPGGWYMIAPPKGSFSYVPRKYVRTIRNGVGEISDEGVVALVGTEFGREATVFQRSLSVGQQVQILGEAQIVIDTERGPETVLKIVPPRREYRWIPGRSVIPADQIGRNGLDGGAFDAPQRPAPRTQAKSGFLGDRPVQRRRNTGNTNRRDIQTGNNRTTIDPARLNADRARLEQLDDRFRAIISKPTSQWDFVELEAGYLQLQQNAAHPALANQVNLRLPALKKYQRTKRQYDDFVSLTSATTQRDRELTRMSSGVNSVMPPAAEILPAPPRTGSTPRPSVYPNPVPRSANRDFANPLSPPQTGYGAAQAPLPAFPSPVGNGNGGQTLSAPSATLPETGPINTDPEPPPTPSPFANRKAGPIDPIFDPPAETPAVRQPIPVPPGMTRVPQRNPRFAGAGVVMRSTDLDVPEYVLLAPTGRILAYLEPVGELKLGQHVNVAMGVEGDRFHSNKWKADFIKVRKVIPITLK